MLVWFVYDCYYNKVKQITELITKDHAEIPEKEPIAGSIQLKEAGVIRLRIMLKYFQETTKQSLDVL